MITEHEMAVALCEASWRGGCDRRHVEDALRAFRDRDEQTKRGVLNELRGVDPEKLVKVRERL